MGFDSLEPSQQTSHLAERIDSSSHVPATKSATVKSEKFAQPVSPLQVTDTDMEGATLLESPSKSEERSLPQPQHQPSTPSVKDEPCSPDIAPPGYENLDSLEQPPPPLCSKFGAQCPSSDIDGTECVTSPVRANSPELGQSSPVM
uniref:Uncharacterized protein n=1 Tax=Arundo donax TaxID=35708 RepID=A0A0A9BXA1_ARUDO